MRKVLNSDTLNEIFDEFLLEALAQDDGGRILSGNQIEAYHPLQHEDSGTLNKSKEKIDFFSNMASQVKQA